MNTYDAMLSTDRLRLPPPIPIQTLLDGKVVESERVEFKRGSSTVRARDHDEAELLSLTAIVPFDDRVNQRASVSDLSSELIRTYLVEVQSELASHVDSLTRENVGRHMRIVDGPAEEPLPISHQTPRPGGSYAG